MHNGRRTALGLERIVAGRSDNRLQRTTCVRDNLHTLFWLAPQHLAQPAIPNTTHLNIFVHQRCKHLLENIAKVLQRSQKTQAIACPVLSATDL
jgi:hypothetical protein